MKDAVFSPVTDARNHPIRGLWQRNGRFYAQMRLPGKKSATRVPLLQEDGQTPCVTAPEAVAARHRVVEERRQGKSPAPRITPEFDSYVVHYLAQMRLLKAKAQTTIDTQDYLLRAWKFGTLRLAQLTAKTIMDRRSERKGQDGVSNHTLNLELAALRSVLGFAVSEGYLRKESLPTEGVKNLPYKSPQKVLLADDAVDQVCAEAVRTAPCAAPKAALMRQIMELYREADGTVGWARAFAAHPDWQAQLEVSSEHMPSVYARAHYLAHHSGTGRDLGPVPVYSNGQLFADWIRFMAYTGARNAAARLAEWKHVDWDRRQLHLFTKRSQEVIVPFHPKLEAHLKDMAGRRFHDATGTRSPYLFPSPRGAGAIGSFAKTLGHIRRVLHYPTFTAHYLRHYFISMAVMSGMDYMTIAAIVGHSDGGILIAQRYGHLRVGHKEEQIQKLSFDRHAPEPSKLEQQLEKLTLMVQALQPGT